MGGRCPDEAARTAVRESDADDLARLRAEARTSAAERRGGAALISRDHPSIVTDHLVETALDGASDVTLIVGTLDDMVAGYVLVRLVEAEESERVASVVELWVTPDARKLGVGEAMMGLVLDWADERGCVELDAEALPGDRDTKNFYEIHGLVARKIQVSRRLGRHHPAVDHP